MWLFEADIAEIMVKAVRWIWNNMLLLLLLLLLLLQLLLQSLLLLLLLLLLLWLLLLLFLLLLIHWLNHIRSTNLINVLGWGRGFLFHQRSRSHGLKLILCYIIIRVCIYIYIIERERKREKERERERERESAAERPWLSTERAAALAAAFIICVIYEHDRLRETDTHPTGLPLPPNVNVSPCPTANLRTKIMDFRGFDPSRILMLRGGIPRTTGNFPESSSQAISV